MFISIKFAITTTLVIVIATSVIVPVLAVHYRENTTALTMIANTTHEGIATAGSVTNCATTNGVDLILRQKQLLYSPNHLFAFGIGKNAFGIFNVSRTGTTSTSDSTFYSLSSRQTYFFAAQADGNLVLYEDVTPRHAVWAPMTLQPINRRPYCLYLLNTGELVWLDKTNTVLWRTS